MFSPQMVKPIAAPGARAGAPTPTVVPAATPVPPVSGVGESIYRHQAELTVAGNIGTLLGYLQTLQGMPGDLRLQKLQFTVAAYPQASIQLTLQTLSGRAETPFN